MTFNITYEQAGKTVLSFLKSNLKISSSALSALKRDPIGIRVNGLHVTVRYVLKENDLLMINEADLPEESNDAILPVNIALNIIFENEDIMLIDKPPHMPTHPSHGHTDDTLANAVAYVYKSREIPFVFRPIGRLDRNTSGISLVAKHIISASFMDYARQKNLIKKKYLAILSGRVESDGDYHIIDTYMKRQAESIIVRCVGNADDPDSFRAITQWRLLYANDDISVVEAIPLTGRTHQLRVHFAHIGHPILGDDVYGTPISIIDRHALHAASLSLPIPYGDKAENFLSPPHADLILAAKHFNCDLVDIFTNGFINEPQKVF